MTIPQLVGENIKRVINLDLDLITPGEFAVCTKGTSQVVISIKCLKRIFKEAKHMTYKEHIENYCFENFKKFKIDYQIVKKKFYFNNLNFSIDTNKQLNFIKKNKIKKFNQKLFAILNKIKNKKENYSTIYNIDENKYLKKNRIGYFYLADFYKSRNKMLISDVKINKKNNINVLKKIFYTEFVDKKKNIYFPDFNKNKFIKLNFKDSNDSKWNSFFYQKKRIYAYRQKFLIK